MNKKIVIIGVVLVLVLSMVACSSGDGEGDAEMFENEIPTSGSEENDDNSVTAFGVVTAKKDASISVDFDAKVEKIYVQLGEKVVKGDPLVAFDITTTSNIIKSKERELNQLTDKLNQKNYNIDKLNIQLASEKKTLENMKADFENKKILNESGSFSNDDLKKVKDSIDEKILSIQSTDLNMKSTREDEKNNKVSLNNQIVNLTEEINQINDKLTKSNFVNGNQVISNFNNAVVTEVNSKEGDFVNRLVKVITVIDLDSRIVTADIAEEFIGKIKEGQTVTITSSALVDKVYEGVVSRVWASSIKKGGETIVPIEISIFNLDDQLMLNFNVDAKINLDS